MKYGKITVSYSGKGSHGISKGFVMKRSLLGKSGGLNVGVHIGSHYIFRRKMNTIG